MYLFPRMVLIAMALDVLLSGLLAIGGYFGFSVYFIPVINEGLSQELGLRATIPLGIPSITEIGSSLTFLPMVVPTHWFLTFLFTLLFIAVQSFARGMYFGAMKGSIQQNSSFSTLQCGRYFWSRMFGWSLLQWTIGTLLIYVSLIFWPIGILLFLVFFFFVLTPHLIVLKDLRIGEALLESPRKLKRYFTSFLPIAFTALLLTGMISLLNLLSKPFNYVLPLLVYSVIGTWLVLLFFTRLYYLVRRDKEVIPQLPMSPMLNKKMNLSKNSLVVLLVALFIVLPIIGMLFSSGHHLLAFSIINKHEEWNGVPFIAPWSDVYRESDKQYSTYLWGDEKRKVQLYLPQLDEGVIHKEIRGIGKISWLVEQDGRYKSSDAGFNGVRNVPVESFFYFRLLPDQTREGTLYYTSEKGSASIISFQEPAREPLDLEVVLSANGKNLFLLRYPSRFPATGLLTVSPYGNYVTPEPSSMNTGDFTYFWFSETVGTEDFLNMLQGKNQSIRFYNKEFPIQLITALQEADGAMITRILERADDMGVTVDAPEMTANEWTSFLRSQYDGLDYQELIRYLNLVGEQFTYVWEEQASSESYSEYQIKISFPQEREITVVEVRSEARDLVEIRVILDEGE